MSKQHPDNMGPPIETWMVLTDDGPEYFETEDEAKEQAESSIEDYRLDGEHTLASQVVVARVAAFCKSNAPFADADGDEYDDEESSSFHEDDTEYTLVDIFWADERDQPHMH